MSEPNVTMVDRDLGVMVLNDTNLATGSVREALMGQHPEVAALVRWTVTTQGEAGGGRDGGIFARDRYVTPSQIFAQFRTAQDACMNDDVVSSVLESTESLAFGRMSFSAGEEDLEDVWNQIAFDIDLDSRIREMWRELFTVSQFYCVTWWGTKSYRVRGTSPGTGIKRKKVFDNLTVPLGLTILDPVKVVPVGNLMFNQEQLAYVADRTEVDLLDASVLNDPQADPVSRQIIVAKYAPPDYERRNLARQGINADWLYILNPRNVWRHTATRSQYRRFAEVRLTSVFELLDLKHQLRQMDRAHLIGGPLAAETPVATDDRGWVNIGQLRPGDKVIAVDGTPTTVTGVFPQGELQMYEVTFTDGTSIMCDETHGWTVRAPKGQWRKIALSQIMAEGIMQPNGIGVSGKPQMRYRHEVLLSEPWQLPALDYLLDPYLMGYMLGDGNFDGTPSIACAEDDHPWEEVLPDGIRVVKNRCENIEWSLSGGGPGRPAGGLRGNPIKAALEKMNLWGVHCRNKFIPEEYLWGSIEQRWALLQGLCDSDGSAHVGGAMFGNASGKLVDDVCQLVQSLGGLATKHNYPNEAGDFWHVQIQFNGDRCPFRLARKAAAWSPRKRQMLKRCIAKIEPRGREQAVCIHVEHPSHVFMTKDGIASNNTNFIVLIKKGTDRLPAKPTEISNLQGQVTTLARVPVIVGDHRLSVEIVTPKTDWTLNPDKHATLDSRITARLYQMFQVHGGSGAVRSDDSVKLAKIIARGLESRRFMMKQTIERQVIHPCVAANPVMTEYPSLRFHPTRIELDFDAATATFLMELRDRGDLSRDSILNEFDFDQQDEFVKRTREARDYDDTFLMTNVPYSAPGPGHVVPVGSGGKPKEEAPGTGTNQPPAPVTPHSHGPDGTPVALPSAAAAKPGTNRTAQRSAGRTQGGNRNGGGAAPGTGQGQAPRGRTK